MSIGVDVDGELLVVRALTELLADPAVRVLTVLPATVPPLVVRVTLAPGSTSDYDTSTLRVDVESFAASREGARDLAGRVHNAVRALPGRVAAGQQFDAVAGQLPVERFWSTSAHRYVGTYVLDLRAH